MIKVIVFSDIHANLPALKAMAKEIKHEGYDAAFHTGDAIGMGPFPSETLDALLNIPKIHPIMGNHDAWFINGLPKPRPHWLTDEELKHYRWTYSQIDLKLKNLMAQWPYLAEHEFEGLKTAFVHYTLTKCGKNISLIINDPITKDMDKLTGHHSALLVFHGHSHHASDIKGKVRYINPGSLGCYHKPAARYLVATFNKGKVHIEHREANYDDTILYNAFEKRNVPKREFIYSAFFGDRWKNQKA